MGNPWTDLPGLVTSGLLGTPSGWWGVGKGTLWRLALVRVARQATEGIYACSTQATLVCPSTRCTIYAVSFWFSFSGGSLSGLLSHLFRMNLGQYLEDSHSKMGMSDIYNHLSLGVQCPWGSLLQESQLLVPSPLWDPSSHSTSDSRKWKYGSLRGGVRNVMLETQVLLNIQMEWPFCRTLWV